MDRASKLDASRTGNGVLLSEAMAVTGAKARPDPKGNAYNSCRDRHCPKCQSSAAKRWLDAREADLLPVEYDHVVFTPSAPIADIASQNKAALHGLLFDISAEALLRVAADPKHLGAYIGATLVLHTWGSTLKHRPHVNGIVPGGGLAPGSKSWVACRPGLFLPLHVLSRLFRRRFLLHVLPGGFHWIRHYGMLSNSNRRDDLTLARQLLHVTPPAPQAPADGDSDSPGPTFVCAHCGHAMNVLQVFLRDRSIRTPPAT